MDGRAPFMVGDRVFTAADLELIRWTTERFGNFSQGELALTICENLEWKAPNGELRVHLCMPLLEQLATAGMVHVSVQPGAGSAQNARRLAPQGACPTSGRQTGGHQSRDRLVWVHPLRESSRQ